MLLRVSPSGSIARTLVSGRVMFGESIRTALFRHLEKDLGPMAFPQLPSSPTPFTVAEYFPLPGASVYTDERQHAISLAYVVRSPGRASRGRTPSSSRWMSPMEAASDAVAEEMEGGRGTLLRAGLASVGALH